MNIENFRMLTSVIHSFSEDSPNVHMDLVQAWKSLGVWGPVMDMLPNKADFFRGLCMWLQADAELTSNLISINGNLSGKRISSKEMFEEMQKLSNDVL